MKTRETSCWASVQMIDKTARDGVETVFDRVKTRKICPYGSSGTCCQVCNFGPCRVSEVSTGYRTGVCGATVETIVARNFARMVAAGTAAHSDHGREVALTFLAAAQGRAPFAIRDLDKLRAVAASFGITEINGDEKRLAVELGQKVLAEFGKQEGELVFAKRAPQRRQDLWRRLGVMPRGIDREVVEMLHSTTVGVDQDYEHIILQAMRTSLADGWGGSMIATELQDIMFGTPVPVRVKADLGVLKEDHVNIVVHGHEPLLPEVLITALRDEELQRMTREAGAKGINLVGICCTANEILMRHGIPLAGGVLQQELAIATGAVDLMVVDVQCVMQGLAAVASCYHTELVTTSSRAKIHGVTHLEFHPEHAEQLARELIKRAIANFPKRGAVEIPQREVDLVAGFSHETIQYILGGRYRASYSPLNENIINGRIRGVVAVIGCSSPRVRSGYVHSTLVKELIANNVLVLTTGCAAIALAKEGLLIPEAAELAGSGLREVCEAVGIPPVLHCGSCVDNSRLLIAATEMVHTGGLGDDLGALPLGGCAPEWMSEKAVAIGHYFVTSGVPVGFGVSFPTSGSEVVSDFLFDKIETLTGGRWFYEADPVEMAQRLIEAIDAKRRALGIEAKKERVLYDMDMRRQLKVV